MRRVGLDRLRMALVLVCLPAGYALAIALGVLRYESAPDGGPFELSFAVLLAGFLIAELLTVDIESRSEAHSVNFVELTYVVALVLADPLVIVAARVVGLFLIVGVVRRQSPLKLAVNLAMAGAESATACLIFSSLLGGMSPVEPKGWLVIYASTIAGYLVSNALVSIAITALSGFPGRRMLQQVLVVGGVVAIANTTIGIVLVGSLWEDSYLGILVVAVAAVLFLLHRSYTRLNERYKSLETLHDFTRGLGGSLELQELERAVVEGARGILRGEQAALLLPPIREGAPATRVLLAGEDLRRASVSPTELAADLAILLPTGESRLYEPGQPLPGWLGEIGIRDAVIVPLLTDGITSGAILVANRLTEVSEFVDEDLRVFETLASHASVALENGRLVAHLQFEAQEQAFLALHDPVTGLPNRTSLQESLEQAIHRAKQTELGVGLIFIDLDTFKEVRDTLGTATSDRLLLDVRQRLQALLPTTATLARFTGDQFAVLVSGTDGSDPVIELAERVHAEFDTPFTADAVSLVLGASLGIAVYPEHASAADLLLQRADAATYAARLEGSGIEIYAAESDPYAPRRLALAADLREALARDEVDVYVQPKVALADGEVVGAEALVRWTHPRLGPLSPDQFIPAAEHTGVIRALTVYVVRGALAQCRAWRDAGLDLTISVNLSARNLFDSHLVADISEAIATAGVPAEVLTLELTESTVMGGSHRSLAVLEGLQDLGVGLSVDDFGTGYSSLSHLRQLPVTELKVDKSFVSTMTTNDHDKVIVRTLIDLGRSLGLRTVAEGVESRDAWDLLREFGCDEAQGYLLSRPLPAGQFTSWLSRQQVRRIDLGDAVVPFNPRARRAVNEED